MDEIDYCIFARIMLLYVYTFVLGEETMVPDYFTSFLGKGEQIEKAFGPDTRLLYEAICEGDLGQPIYTLANSTAEDNDLVRSIRNGNPERLDLVTNEARFTVMTLDLEGA